MILNSLLVVACFVLHFNIVASNCPRCPVSNDAYCPYLYNFQWSEANGDWDEAGTVGGQTKYTQQMYGKTATMWYSDTTWMATGWSIGWYSWRTQWRYRFGYCPKDTLLDCTANDWMYYQNTDGDSVYNDPTTSSGWSHDNNAQMLCWTGNGWANAAMADDGLNSNPSGAEDPGSDDWIGLVFGAGIGVVAVMVVVVLLLMLKRRRNRVERAKSTEMAKVDIAANVEPVVDDSKTMRTDPVIETDEGGDVEEAVVVDAVSA